MYTSLLRWGRLLIAGALIFFLVKRLYRLLAEIEVEVIAFQSPLWLIVSFVLLLVYFCILGIPWFFSYRAGSGQSISYHNSDDICREKSGSLCGCFRSHAGSAYRKPMRYSPPASNSLFSAVWGHPRIRYLMADRGCTAFGQLALDFTGGS